ncbi:MAG: hypothetical protein P8078_06600, partial [bacterium]
MKKLILLFTASVSLLILGDPVRGSDVVQYVSNPYTFSVTCADTVYRFGDHFMVYDVNNDGAVDFLFRTLDSLYAYDHYSTGTELWGFEAAVPFQCNGTSFGCADIDGDGQAEVVLLDNSSYVHVLNAETGVEERSFSLDDVGTGLGDYQKGGYLVVVNIQAPDDWDIIVQTVDETLEGNGTEFYINRSLIAIDMDESVPANMEIWRKVQDRVYAPFYENYWGQAHGGLMCADVDNDGLDEVIGGSMIDDDGTEVSAVSSSYPEGNWVYRQADGFTDHIDAIAVGDYRPQNPGLEWCVTQEDHVTSGSAYPNLWETVLFDTSGYIWRQETTLFPDDKRREPQNIAVGNFDNTLPYAEIWNRSRFGAISHAQGYGQHPWIFDNNSNQIGHYDMQDKLDAVGTNFSNNNAYGIEAVWTID